MWIILAILALPLVEIGLFVTLGAQLGLWLTLGWVMLTGVMGVLLLQRLALGGRDSLRRGFREGLQDPLSPLAHRAMIGVAAGFLILPGFLTDALGLLLLLPPLRSGIIWLMARRLRGVVVVRHGDFRKDGNIYEHQGPDDLLR